MNPNFRVVRPILNIAAPCFPKCGQFLFSAFMKECERSIGHFTIFWSLWIWVTKRCSNKILCWWTDNLTKVIILNFLCWYLFSFKFQAVIFKQCQNYRKLKKYRESDKLLRSLLTWQNQMKRDINIKIWIHNLRWVILL